MTFIRSRRRAALAAVYIAAAVGFWLIAEKHLSAASTPDVPQTRPTSLVNSVGMKLALISPGEFQMGSPDDEPGRFPDETQHRVRISKPFSLGVYEVTQKQFAAVMGTNPSEAKGDDLPVDNISWNDAMAFCKKLSDKEGKTYRLPTEAEWEYACRAGTMGPYAGDGKLDDMGWYGGNSHDRTQPVGTRQANAWGLYDMHGNVWEWCADWYGEYPTDDAADPTPDPTGPETGKARVLRGGAWDYDGPDCCRSADRYWKPPGYHASNTGFRVATD